MSMTQYVGKCPKCKTEFVGMSRAGLKAAMFRHCMFWRNNRDCTVDSPKDIDSMIHEVIA